MAKLDGDKRKTLLQGVENFLNRNYPCKCPADDEQCPGNYYEAEAIVEMVEDVI